MLNIVGHDHPVCDHIIEARTPDIVVVEKECNKAIIVDIASP